VLGFFHTACNLSLLPDKRQRIIYSFIIFAGVFACFGWSKSLNIKGVDQFLADFSTLSTSCTFQVMEGLTIMFVSLVLIKSHYQTTREGWFQKIASYIALAPSLVFLVGMFLVQTYAFNMIEETPFYQIALAVAIVGFLLLLITAFAITGLIQTWESRIEIKIILSFLQILVAMFLPIIVIGNKLQQSHFVVDFAQTMGTIIMLSMVVFAGLYWQQLKLRRIQF